jgi:hypothetical protein
MTKNKMIKKMIKKTRKQKGGSIDLNRKTDTNYDDWIQYLSIGLLIIALVLGISVFMQRRKPIKNEKIIYKDRIVEKPININIDDGLGFYEEKIERRLEPPGIVYESDRYMPRTYVEPRRATPINIRTRGSPQDYQQIGILTNVSDSNDVRPLYGRQTYRGSNNWNYYSSLDSNLSTKIPIFKASDKCTDERGCQEINEGDNVTIGNVSSVQYTFTKYSNDSFRYIPDLF